METNIFNLCIKIFYFILVITTYWLLPCKNFIVLISLILIHYNILSWYDYSTKVQNITSNVIPIYRHFYHVVTNKQIIQLKKNESKELKILECVTIISVIVLILLLNADYYFFEKKSYIL